MDLEMDIDMDMDVNAEESMPTVEILPSAPSTNEPTEVLSSDLDVSQPTPHKVHLRGLDNLTTNDIKSFAAEYFSEDPVIRVEWIDDTSANIVYTTPAVAQKALAAFASIDVPQGAPLLQTIPAKPFPLHPETHLEVRLAVLGDQKQAGARDRSRFYLMNPEYDPAERKKRQGTTRRRPRTYRDREDGGYRSQKYDDYEDQRRKDHDGFDASLYDDDEATLSTRRDRYDDRQRSKSSLSSDAEAARISERKELFPNRGFRAGSGRLRDRSASPARDNIDERRPGSFGLEERRVAKNNDNRIKARALRNHLRQSEDSMPKELFPQKQSRPNAFDATDETADLFASRMPVPFYDGASDQPLKSRPLAAQISSSRLEGRLSSPHLQESDGFSIKGTAKSQASSGFAIKGSASVSSAKELFPGRLGSGNSGKELFAERLEGRGSRRRKAEDMFG